MKKILMFAYALACYALSFAAVLYAIGFVGGFGVPRTLDNGPLVAPATAVLIDLLLVGLFALQHSVMARPAFKQWWTGYLPEPIERATYLLATSVALGLIFWLWRPLPGVLWDLSGSLAGTALWAAFGLGWFLVVFSGFLIDHFHLFGLRQVHAHLTGSDIPEKGFTTPLLYRWVRHPIYFGLLLGIWATPLMTFSHLLFAVAFSVYIIVGAHLEEHDLEAWFGDRYRQYRKAVPMLVPWRRRRTP